MITLDDYLDLASARRWAWGDMDCVQFGLGWIRARTGRDLPAWATYSDSDAAVAALRAHGGLESLVAAWMQENWFKATDAPEDGDVGVVPVPRTDRMNIAGACVVIRRGPWWIGKALRGIASMGARETKAWRIS